MGKNDETALHDDTDSQLQQDAADTTGWSFCWTVSVHDIYLRQIITPVSRLHNLTTGR
jgi:hypothetical protein